MANPKILVVEDERDVRDLMTLHLKREGFDVVGCDSGEEAIGKLSAEPLDLVVLDWMLPGLSGLEICKRLRSVTGLNQRTPVLMVTARADAADVVLGLEVGADDYVSKPFEIPVMTARVRALLRRGFASKETSSSKILQIQNLKVDLDSHQVFCNDGEIPLTPSEFRLLSALLENRGRVLSREKLIELVQGNGVSVGDRTVDTHVFGLRKKLGPCSDVIETIRGVGYRVLG